MKRRGWVRIVWRNGSISLDGLAIRFGVPALGVPAALALLLGGLWVTWRSGPDANRASGAAIACALLASPLTWIAYSLVNEFALHGPESERERNLNLVSRLAPCAVILFIDLLRNGFGLSLRPADSAPADPAPADLPPADPAPTMSVPEPMARGALSEKDAIPDL